MIRSSLYRSIASLKNRQSNGSANSRQSSNSDSSKYEGLLSTALPEGYLMKKSGNKLQFMMQKRYCRVYLDDTTQCHYLEYSKSPDSEYSERNRFDLATVDWVRPFDTSENCKKFEIKHDGRVYLFEAASNNEMTSWVTSIQVIISESKTQDQQENLGFVKQFEMLGKDGYINMLRNDILTHIYQIPLKELTIPIDNLSEKFNVSSHVTFLNELTTYLRNSIDLKISKTKRYDVLCTSVNTIVSVATSFLQPILQEYNPAYLQATLDDLHGLITALSSFQNQLNLVYYGNRGTRHLRFTLTDCLPDLCDRYVNGTSTASSQHDQFSLQVAMANPLQGVVHIMMESCTSIVDRFLTDPGEWVERHDSADSFNTRMPSELWTLIHEQLNLAHDSNCTLLQVLMINKIAAALSRMCAVITEFVNDAIGSRIQIPDEYELELVCALANDIIIHIESMNRIVEGFDYPELREQINTIFDTVVTEMMELGNLCLRRLEVLAIDDIGIHLNQVMTYQWLHGNPVEIAVATLRDYFEDLATYLKEFWLEQFTIQLMQSIVVRYTRCVVFPNKPISPRNLLFSRSEDTPNSLNNRQSHLDADEPTSRFSFGLSANSTTSIKVSVSHRSSRVNSRSNSRQHSMNFTDRNSGRFSHFYSPKPSECHSSNLMTLASVGVNDGFQNQLVSQPMVDSTSRVPVNQEALARVGRDLNTLNQLFNTLLDDERLVQSSLSLLSELVLYLNSALPGIICHVILRVFEYPSAAQSIHETARGCLILRTDLPPSALEEYLDAILPAIQMALDKVSGTPKQGLPKKGEVPSDIGGMYQALVNSLSTNSMISASNDSLPESKDQIRTSVHGESDASATDDETTIESSSPEQKSPISENGKKKSVSIKESKLRRFSNLMSSPIKRKQMGLVAQVLGIVKTQTEDCIRNFSEKKSQVERRELENQRLQEHLIILGEWMDKRSPKNALIWQKRWFQFVSTLKPGALPSNQNICPYIYSIQWSKKEGSSVLNSVEVEDISSFGLLEVQRDLVYNATRGRVVLESQLVKGNEDEEIIAVQTRGSAGPVIALSQYYVLVLTMNESLKRGDTVKEHTLRCTNVDKLISWINSLSQAGGMAYDPARREWTRERRRATERETQLRVSHLEEKAQLEARVSTWFQKSRAGQRGQGEERDRSRSFSSIDS